MSKNSIQEPSLYTLFISELAAASFLASLAGSCLTLRIRRVFVFCALNNNTQLLIVAYFQARPLLLYIRLSSSRSFPSVGSRQRQLLNYALRKHRPRTSLSARPYYMKKGSIKCSVFPLLLLFCWLLLLLFFSDSLCFLWPYTYYAN